MEWMIEPVTNAALNSKKIVVVNDYSKLGTHGLRRMLQTS